MARYDGTAERWASGASLVYGPLATELVERTPHPLADRVVLDVGAGTGAGSEALRSVGAVPIALDTSHDMLGWNRGARPPSVVASVDRIPLAAASVDDIYASFVLNHVSAPVLAIRELAASARSGGALLSSTFSSESGSAARNEIDVVAGSFGWEAPAWYLALKTEVMPLLGDEDAVRAAALAAGLVDIEVECTAVDVGVSRADQLVDYRLGQAQVTEWLATLSREQVEHVREAAIAAVEPVMEPYRPIVLFLTATVP